MAYYFFNGHLLNNCLRTQEVYQQQSYSIKANAALIFIIDTLFSSLINEVNGYRGGIKFFYRILTLFFLQWILKKRRKYYNILSQQCFGKMLIVCINAYIKRLKNLLNFKFAIEFRKDVILLTLKINHKLCIAATLAYYQIILSGSLKHKERIRVCLLAYLKRIENLFS